MTKFYIDCEFDGHNGPLLSIGIVRDDGYGAHIRVERQAFDPWVLANVIPFMHSHRADLPMALPPNDVGGQLRAFIAGCEHPVIVADSPVDIGRFCQAVSTNAQGGWQSNGYPRMSFEVYNVDCYPTELEGAVQHNAWWDAMALREILGRG